jgi:flagellar basal body-associated protein FliL
MASITKNKPFLALAAVVLVSLPLLYFFVVRPQMAGGSEAPALQATQTTVPSTHYEGYVGPTYTIEERVVNLQTSAGGARYLRMEVVLEFQAEDPNFYTLTGEAHKKAQEKFLEEMAPKAPLIEDAVLTTVSSKSADQLLTPAGKDRLKSEIAEAVSKRINGPRVVNVYFTQFVAQ